MDETTRMIIAYATLLFGIPVAAARIIWVIPGTISSKALAHIADRLDEFTDAAIEGFISLLLACLVFEHLELQIVWKVPLILIVVSSLWSWINEKTLYALASAMGIVTGFLLYPKVLPLLKMYFGS